MSSKGSLKSASSPTFATHFFFWISQGADPDGEDPEGNKLMDTVKDDAIKSMLKNA